MNKKNKMFKIAKSLFLQQSIARQLFAKLIAADSYVPQTFDESAGSFARLSQKMQSVFYGFVGSYQRTPYPQIVQKNGMKFKIHKINLDNTVSDQIYNNAQYDINQISFILRKLYARLSQGGLISFKNSIKQLQKLWSNPSSNSSQRAQTLIDKLQSMKSVLIAIGQFVTDNIDYISTISDLQNDILSLKNLSGFGADTEQYDKLDQKMWDFIFDFQQFISDKTKKNYVQTVNMAMNRLKSFVKLYEQFKTLSQIDENQFEKDMLNILQKCNTNVQLDQEVKSINLKNYLHTSYDEFEQQDESIGSFIRFVKNIEDNPWIKCDTLDEAISYYLKLPDGVLSENAKQCLKQLKIVNQRAKKDNGGDDPILNGLDISSQIRTKVKQCQQQLI